MSQTEQSILDAVRRYKQKQNDRELTIKSMHNHPERYPKTDERARRLAIELVDDLRDIGQLIIDGGE